MDKSQGCTEFKLSVYPRKIPLTLWSIALIFLGLNVYLWFNFVWYAGVAYLVYIFAFIFVFIVFYCRKCYYYGRRCPFLIGKAISALHIPSKTQRKRLSRRLFHRVGLISLIVPTAILVLVSLIINKETFVEILSQLLFLGLATLDSFIIFIRTRNEIACRYCFNQEQCFTVVSSRNTN